MRALFPGFIGGVLLGLLPMGCIADRVPGRDDDRVVDAEVDAGLPADAAPLDAAPLDAALPIDAAPLDATPIDLGPDAAPPPVCLLDFDAPAPATAANRALGRAGAHVWWHDSANAAWIDVDGAAHRAPLPLGQLHAGDGWLASHDNRGRTIDRVDLTTGVAERVGASLRSVRIYHRWLTWGGPDGLFAQGPSGPPLRLADCIRTCTAPMRSRDALWYLGRSRGQVEPALFRVPDDGGTPRAFEGPIREPRLTTGQETVWWWTINDPPMGDLGRQIIAAGDARIGHLTPPDQPAPAWAAGPDVAAFYDADAQQVVLLHADGRRGVIPGIREVIGAGSQVVFRDPQAREVVFYDPLGERATLRLPGESLQVVLDAPLADPLILVVSPEDGAVRSRILRVGARPEVIVDVPGHIARTDWAPGGEAVLVNFRGVDAMETRGVDLRSGRTWTLPVVLTAEDGGGWLDAERIMWLDPAGRLVVEAIADGERRTFGEGFAAVQRLGRGADGCQRVVVGWYPEDAPLLVSPRVIPDP